MAPLDVLLFDAALICRYAVLGEGTLFGRTADQFLGQPVDAIFPPARDDLRTAMELTAGGSDASYQYPAYRYTYSVSGHPRPARPVACSQPQRGVVGGRGGREWQCHSGRAAGR